MNETNNTCDSIEEEIQRKNAIEKLWPLLGFRLRDKLAQP